MISRLTGRIVRRTPSPHFLLGEASFRRARASEALAHYREAVRLDSTFALAAVRGAQAATWDHRSSEAESLIRRALAQKMSPQFTHFALGYAAYLEGRPDSATIRAAQGARDRSRNGGGVDAARRDVHASSSVGWSRRYTG